MGRLICWKFPSGVRRLGFGVVRTDYEELADGEFAPKHIIADKRWPAPPPPKVQGRNKCRCGRSPALLTRSLCARLLAFDHKD